MVHSALSIPNSDYERPVILGRSFALESKIKIEFNYFKHFDALVFIGNGEKVSY